MKRNRIAIGIVCMILGMVLSMQYKVIQNNYLNGITPSKRQSDLVNELIALKEEKSSLISELEEKMEILDDIEESASQDNAIIKNLTRTIEKYEILAGMTDVVGEGIVLTIDNPPSDPTSIYEYNIIYHYETLVSLINELNAAGAEAISINDQRIVSTTEIRIAGNGLNVNYVPQSVPLVIKAIGKKNALEGALTGIEGKISRLRDFQLLVDLKTMDEIIIPRFRGSTEFDYVKTRTENND